MYAGRAVERAPTRALFEAPLHPYTKGLLASVPGAPAPVVEGARKRLPTIAGVVPDLAHLPEGCRFRDRCQVAVERCGNFLNIDVLALEREARRSGRHFEFRDLRQHVQQRLCQAIREILVVLIIRHVIERQNSN